MTSNKPYLIRALYEWLLDNNATPHILVNSEYPQVSIPPGIDKDDQVVLNLAPQAVQDLQMQNEFIFFSARFSGVSQQLTIPVAAVMAIYSREDGQGMMFSEDTSPPAVEDNSEEPAKPETSKPGLKLVT